MACEEKAGEKPKMVVMTEATSVDRAVWDWGQKPGNSTSPTDKEAQFTKSGGRRESDVKTMSIIINTKARGTTLGGGISATILIINVCFA